MQPEALQENQRKQVAPLWSNLLFLRHWSDRLKLPISQVKSVVDGFCFAEPF
jgi:hypothetical protein